MANRRTYKPSRTSSGFRSVGQGLQASRRELQDQAQIRIDSLKLAKEQHREASNIQISGLSDSGRFQEGVLKEKHVLESAVRTRQNEAMSIKADRDVDRLKGKADEAQRHADFIAKYGPFAPKSIQNYMEIGRGVAAGLDAIQGDKLIKEAIERGDFNQPHKWNEEARAKIESLLGKDFEKALKNNEIDIAKELYNSKLKGSRNKRYGAWVLDQINAKASGEFQAVQQIIGDQKDAQGRQAWSITQDNADEIYEFAAFERLRQLGVSPTSKAGLAIIAKYQSWGRLAAIQAKNIKDTEDTAKTIKESLDDIVALKGLKDEESLTTLNQSFNDNVGITQAGTWSDGKGNFVLGVNAGKGNSFQHYGSRLVTEKASRFNTEEEVRDFFDRLKIPDPNTESGFSKTETWGSKHGHHVDEIVKAWNTEHKRLKNKAGQAQESRGIVLRNDIYAKINERNAIEDGDDEEAKKGLPSQEDFSFGLIKTIESADVNDDVRSDLYTDLNLLNEHQTKYDDKFIVLYNLLNPEDPAKAKDHRALAVSKFNSYTQRERDVLRPKFEYFMLAKDVSFKKGDITYTNMKAISMENNVFIKASAAEPGSGTNSTTLHRTGHRASARMDQKIMDLAWRMIKAPPLGNEKENKYANNHVLAFKEAREVIEQEFKDGHPSNEGTKEWEASEFKRESLNFGLGVTGWVFTGFADTKDDETNRLLAEKARLSEDGTLANLDETLRGADIVEIESDKLQNSIRHLGYSYEDLIGQHKHLIASPKNMQALNDYVIKDNERMSLGVSGLNRKDSAFSDIEIAEKTPLSDIIGARAYNNILVIMKEENKSKSEVVNDLLKHYGHKNVFRTDDSDESKLQNGVVIRKGNRSGMSYWNGAKVQFVLPMKPEVREYLSGKTIQQIFKDDNGVNYQAAPEGSDHAGTITISNPRKFFDNGGVKVLIRDGVPVNVLQTFGIVPPTTDTSKLPTKGELKDFLSPKEYRKMLDEKRKKSKFPRLNIDRGGI